MVDLARYFLSLVWADAEDSVPPSTTSSDLSGDLSGVARSAKMEARRAKKEAISGRAIVLNGRD